MWFVSKFNITICQEKKNVCQQYQMAMRNGEDCLTLGVGGGDNEKNLVIYKVMCLL